MKKLILFIGTIFLSFMLNLCTSTDSTAEASSSQTVTKEEAKFKAKTYMKSISKLSYPKWNDASFSEEKTLYDLDGKIRAYLFQVKKGDQNYGYIIANGIKGKPSIIESTREGNNPYTGVPEGQAIYIGPLQHLKKENDKVIDIATNQNIEFKEVKQVENSREESLVPDVKYAINTKATEDEYTEKKIGNVPDYTWYRGCSPTAFANIFAYWSQHGFGNLFKNTESSNRLIDNIGDDMGTTKGYRNPDGSKITGGATPVSNMVAGIKKYWNNRGYYPESELITKPTFERYKQEINMNQPFVINIFKHLMYGDHSVTGVGYEELYIADVNEKYQILTVHDTWNTTPVEVSLDYGEFSEYVDSLITIKPRVNGWVTDFNQNWRYVEKSGSLKTGWFQDNGKWYYFDSSGVMKTGWIKDNDKWYYLDSSGAMKTGWITDRYWYYLDSSGAMKTGWIQDSGKWYYLDSSGAMLTNGWITVDGKSYYLRADGSWDENKK
ncbi:hypothetical protein COE80_28135 [Bacillus pseudomycoides]|uniref:C39 family peptidase n=1 Tax=Bacillus pseudomycoides TaxID=64104 RepID=UPI000BFB8217|nr:C39 family peptidase [Bacillus pseudomycoides]PHB16691.1 hypothetical protein COE80_28135 [Bacillus pseudomycoides]